MFSAGYLNYALILIRLLRKFEHWRNKMGAAMEKILMNLLWKVLTEKFMAKMIVHGLKLVADNTENKVDDKIVRDIADALSVQSD